MNCDHLKKDRVNRVYNNSGKVIEYDLACCVCGELLKHYTYGVLSKDYTKSKRKNSFIVKIIEYFEYKFSMLKQLIRREK